MSIPQILLLTLVSAAAAGAESVPIADPLIAELVTPIDEWRHGTASLRVRWRSTSLAGEARSGPSGDFEISDFTWDPGIRYRLEVASFRHGEWQSGRIEGSSDFAAFTALYRLGPAGTPELAELYLYRTYGHGTDPVRFIQPLYGLRHAGGWRDAALVDRQFHLAGRRGDLGQTMIDVPTEYGEVDYRVEFDAAHGGLPTAIHPAPQGSPFVWRCTEWREVEPGWWFPWKGTFALEYEVQQEGRRVRVREREEEWEVTSVERNRSYPAEHFPPPAPAEDTEIDRSSRYVYDLLQSGGDLPALAKGSSPVRPDEIPVGVIVLWVGLGVLMAVVLVRVWWRR